MDDDLILNIAQDERPATNLGGLKKGGRWTERLKAKRLAKRKPRPSTEAQHQAVLGKEGSSEEEEEDQRPQKPPSTIISSLFTNNPKIDAPTKNASSSQQPAKPSNAPLADSSTFEGLGLDPLLMSISKPTSIQRSALPLLLSSRSDYAARDVFIQSQTGSGKTLSFLLPIIQDLLPLSSLSYIDRSVGTLAVIIAPTKELAKQISDVLETLLKMRLRPENESADDAEVGDGARMTRWLVPGLLTGGATRSHEKARLRKGVPILVSTPGRLLDHLQNTSSFNVGKCRWLVLDEADRLMELGFEETITGILDGLDGRRRLAMQAAEQGKGMEVRDWEWKRRRTILCSATIREDVQKLAGKALSDPLMVKATALDLKIFTPPSQLSQKYVVVPLKLRLVTLVALLRTLLVPSTSGTGTKIIVFFSCTDSVDFHWDMFGKASMNDHESSSDEDSSGEEDKREEPTEAGETVETTCPLLPGACIFRLHGSLSTQSRQRSIRGFSKTQKMSKATTSILFCTSVASRGLDLPLVRAVIQYDLPTEGGVTEYIHRVGRTARAGRGGEAWCFVVPSEKTWVDWVESQMHKDEEEQRGDEKRDLVLVGSEHDNVLKSGFGGKGQQHESRATQVQLAFERWVLKDDENATLARRAFLSHMRAYATHPSDEKHIFHIKHLHLGHLAKAFALRDAPTLVGSAKAKTNQKAEKKMGKRPQDDNRQTEKRMQEVVRAQGRLTKRGGQLIRSGVSEFQIAGR
ncbi:DEAD-domain-containing protein [Amanita rubescens]|nr:DEAD-domain-containing protein [Amanita rubescens]